MLDKQGKLLRAHRVNELTHECYFGFLTASLFQICKFEHKLAYCEFMRDAESMATHRNKVGRLDLLHLAPPDPHRGSQSRAASTVPLHLKSYQFQLRNQFLQANALCQFSEQVPLSKFFQANSLSKFAQRISLCNFSSSLSKSLWTSSQTVFSEQVSLRKLSEQAFLRMCPCKLCVHASCYSRISLQVLYVSSQVSLCELPMQGAESKAKSEIRNRSNFC